MTQEDKNLLLKDLCARLPYEVKAQIYNHWRSEYEYETLSLKNYCELIDTFCVEDIKPYLFPLSSMTDTQKQEYTYIVNYISPDDTINWKEGEFIYVDQITQLINFFYSNHLDFRGLIPKDLAIDATGLNIY